MYQGLFHGTCRLSMHWALCHNFSKWKIQHVKRYVQYLWNINIIVWFFQFWCWSFVTRLFIHNFYWNCFRYRFLTTNISSFQESITNKPWFVISILISMLVFPKMLRLYIIMFMFSLIVFVPLFLVAQSNLTYSFVPLILTRHWNNTHMLQQACSRNRCPA